MADIGISININTYDATGAIQEVINRLENAKPAFKTIANFMRKKVIEHFANEEGETAKWKKLSPVTEALRRKGKKKKYGNKILRDTGDLINSIQRGGASGIFESDFQHAKVGTTIFYAKYHQQPDNAGGTNSKKGKLYKRDFMYLKSNDIDELKKILEIYITKGK